MVILEKIKKRIPEEMTDNILSCTRCGGSVFWTVPKGPGTVMVTTWALKGLLSPDFGAYVYTKMVLGPFGSVLLWGSMDFGRQFAPKLRLLFYLETPM